MDRTPKLQVCKARQSFCGRCPREQPVRNAAKRKDSWRLVNRTAPGARSLRCAGMIAPMTKRSSRSLAAVAALVAAVLLVAGCGGDSTDAAPTTETVATTTAPEPVTTRRRRPRRPPRADDNARRRQDDHDRRQERRARGRHQARHRQEGRQRQPRHPLRRGRRGSPPRVQLLGRRRRRWHRDDPFRRQRARPVRGRARAARRQDRRSHRHSVSPLQPVRLKEWRAERFRLREQVVGEPLFERAANAETRQEGGTA